MNIKTIKTLFVSGVIGTLAFLLPLNAATLYVAKEGNDTSAGSVDAPFVTIQKAINVAKEGDVIYVGPGTYSPISLPSSSTKPHITIIGVNGAGETFIDGRGEAQCVNLTRDSYSSSYVAFTNTVIRGFTIRNGYKPGSTGAGVHGGTYINCIVERNVAFYFAAVANALLKNCIIRFNHSEEWINTNPGIPLPPANYYGSICGRSRLENCLIYANESYDGKVLCGDDCEAYNCTIVGNAGRFWDYDKNSCAYNSIIYGNTNATGAVITYAKGVNCYTDDPHFVDFEHGDYRLAGDSPCIDVGNNAYAIGDADLAGNPRIFNGAVDIGAYEWQPETESGTEDIYTETIDGTTWTYVVSNGESTICVPAVGGSAISPAPAGAIKIPAKLGGCPVVEIGDHAMERDWNSTNWNMTAVSFPVTIRRIGENAFANCNKLTAIDIPEGVSDLVIGDRAFLGCALSSLSLPEGVVSIGNQAFSCQLDVDYNFTLSGALVLPESLKSLGWSAFATNNVERVEFKGELPALLNPPEDMSWVTPTYPEAFCANMNWDQTVVYHSTYAESWSNVVQESSQWVNFEEIDDNAQKVVPGFIFAQKSADNYFDTLFPIRENSNGEYELAATNLCASSSPEYTQYAYLTYMRMEGGCRYDFKGHYDDRLFVEVGGQIVLQSVSDCETVNGYYRAPTSGWYLVELRVWNCTGPGGSSEGIKYKLEGDSSWQKFEDPGDGSKFRVEVGVDPLPVINNAPVAIGEYGAEKVGDYRWEFYITEHGAVIESKNWENWRPAVTPAPVGDIVVPRQLNGRTVVGIGNYAFTPDWESEAEMNITSIDIPDTVKSYGDQVFGYGCNFEEFEFKEGVTNLGDYVLMECYYLKRLKVPGSLKTTGYSPFGGGWAGMYNLEELVLGEGLENIGDNWFVGLTAVTELNIPNSVTNIGAYAFSGLGGYYYDDGYGYQVPPPLEVVLPEGLITIGDGAFEGSGGIRELIIPDSVQSVGRYAFEYCALMTNLVLGAGIKELPYYVCQECHALKSVTMPAEVRELGEYCFSGCRKLAEFAFPTGLTSIGEHCFSSCESLSAIDLPAEMSYIGNEAFYYCRELKSVAIPRGINQNVKGIFRGCSGLAEVTFPDDLNRIGNEWFYDCTSLKLGSLPVGVTAIGSSAFYNCDALTALELPSSVSSLGSYAFAYSDNLKSIEIPAAVKEIGSYAFYGCKGLSDVLLAEGLTTIGNDAFYGCNSLCAIHMPDTLLTVQSEAFRECVNLAEVNFPTSLVTIGSHAFRNCRKLGDVELPDSVTSIGDWSFAGDWTFRSFRFPSRITAIPAGIFYDCTNLVDVVIPETVTRINSQAFYNCASLSLINFPSNLQRIESDAFGVCTALKEVVLPDTVTYIGGMAFRHCTSLERVVLSKSIVEIGGAAFFNCESLKEIVVPASVRKMNDRQFAGGLKSLTLVRFMGEPPTVSSWSSTFGEGTLDHPITVCYPIEFETAWAASVVELVKLGITCRAVMPYEGYHAWLSMDRSQYAEGETADVKIHLSNAFEGDVYAYLVPKNEDAFYRCAISGMTCLGETNESRTVCLVAGSTEYVVTNGFTFLDGPAELSFEVLVLTNMFSSTFSTNTIYAVEALNLSVTNVSPEVSVSVSNEIRIETEIGREEQIGWVAHDVEADQNEGFTYNWWVNSGWRESGSATNGGFTVTFNDVGEKTVRLRVTDKDGGWTDRTIRYWINPDSYKTVAFDLGDYGKRSGGGALSQLVKVGEDAVPPEVETDPDEDYVFDGWDAAYTNVVTNVTIHAVYKYSPVPREFRLSLSSETLPENLTSGIRFVIKRTGTPSKSLEVQLSVDREGVIDIPKSVVIPAGNSSMVLTVRPINNSIVDGRRVVNVTCSAEKYTDGEIAITVTDDEVPSVRIELDGEHLREGGAVLVGRVIRDLVTDEPLTVYLSGVSTSRCSYPGSVVIPAGESTASFEIAVVNNDTAEALANMTLRAAAAGYTGDTKSFEVEDDDIPGVRLDIYPEQVSEGAGPKAAYAILSRIDQEKIGQSITVNLVPSLPNQLILQSSVTIPAYTMAVKFPIGTVDNGDDDGDRDVAITGSIYISSCGCSGQPSNGEIIQAMLTVMDNDVPSLSLTCKPTTMREGEKHAGDLILRHNSILAEDLEVRLSFDTEGEIVIPEIVVIPAGESEVVIPVTTLDDGVTDGGKLVSVYADDESGVFKSASTWVQVSDQNLADLKVESISVPTTTHAGEEFALEFKVSNVGFIATAADIDYSIHCIGGQGGELPTEANKIGLGKITGGLRVGDSSCVTFAAISPKATGDWRYIVVLDPESKIKELDSLNNTATSEAMLVCASYLATVSVSAKTYMPGERVELSGSAVMAGTTTPAVGKPVDVYVIVNGMRREYVLNTDADGNFAMTFEPSLGEAGRYTVGACYPGVRSAAEQDYFDILGMKRASSDNIIWDIALGDTLSRTVYIQNRSLTPLTGLVLSREDIPADCELQYTLPETLPAGGQISIVLSATATGVSPSEDYERMMLRLSSKEGAELEIPAFFHSQCQEGHLRATPASVNKTMTVDGVHLVDVEIENDGAGDTGEMSVELPDVPWLRVVTPTRLASVKSGERFTVTLELSPKSDMGLVLNNPYSGGSMVVRCQTGEGVSVPLSFTPVVEKTGAIKIDAVDNNTYILQSAPHLVGANVRVSNPYTGAVVATGLTNADGIWNAEGVPPGVYQVVVTAPNHESFAKEVSIDPARETLCTAFLACQLVSATWNVERTEIEDEYEVKLLLEFDTAVPSSRVRVTMPEELPTLNEGESYAFTINVRNEGVIAAEWVQLTMPEIEGYEFRLSDNGMSVPAGASIDIAAVISRPAKRKLLKASSNDEDEDGETACVRVVKVGTCDGKCGEKYPVYEYQVYFKHGMCPQDVWALAMSNGFAPIVHLFDWMPSITIPSAPTRKKKDDDGKKTGELKESKKWTYERHCFTNHNPCVDSAAECLASLATCVSPAGCRLGLGLCARDVANTARGSTPWWRSTVNCILSGAGCAPNPIVSCAAAGVSCLFNLGLDCVPWDLFKKNKKKLMLAAATVPESYTGESLIEAAWCVREFIQSHRDRITAFFGDGAWAECDSDELALVLQEILSQLESGDELSEAPFKNIIPTGITSEMMCSFIARWNNTMSEWKNKGELPVGDGYIDVDAICESSERMADALERVESHGYDSLWTYVGEEVDKWQKEHDEAAGKLCASVTLQMSQTIGMTREVFDGTLTMYNGHESIPVKNLVFNVSVLDEDGDERKDLFEIISAGTSGGMEGGDIFGEGLSVAASSSGSAMIRFIPKREAAPFEPKVYRFGGTITYIDPTTGEWATIDLNAVTLTVNPSPYLKLDYFVQRDVFADDPNTPDVIEASMPAEIAVLVRNVGAGEAKGVKVSSVQPEALQRDRGLAVEFSLKDFSLDAAALNGSTANLGLNKVELGTIAPNAAKVAQWWFSSSIEGHFSGMQATVAPVNSWNTPDTALVDPVVNVHKLIRSMMVDGDGLPDFLVSESGTYGKPDLLYTSLGDILTVFNDGAWGVGSAIGTGARQIVRITLQPSHAGWNYGGILVPGISRYEIESICRRGSEQLDGRRAWITDRTFRDGNVPRIEDVLHIVDFCENTERVEFEVSLVAKPTDIPTVKSFSVDDEAMEFVVRDSVVVEFSSVINSSTFTVDDLVLRKQGLALGDISRLNISSFDDSGLRFLIAGLSELCDDYARYELVVQCAGIADLNGQLGSDGRSVSWTYTASDSPYIIDAEGIPVRPVRSLNSIIAVASTAVDPASFTGAKITLNDEDVSGALIVRSLDADNRRYEITGFEALQHNDGLYTVTIVGSDLRGLDGAMGVNNFTRSWTRDTSLPVLRSVICGKSINGSEITIEFSENIDNSTMPLSSLRLTCDGQVVALPPSTRVKCVGDGLYVVSGFDSVLTGDGVYEFTVDATGVADEAGNSATGSKSVSWTVDTTPPAKPTDLSVSSDYGSICSVVQTCEGTLAVSGSAPELDVSVQILCKYVGGAETLLARPVVSANGMFSAEVNLPENGGSMTLIVRLTDSAGNSTDAEIKTYYDKIALNVELTGANEVGVPVDVVSLVFGEAVITEDVTVGKFVLTHNGEMVALDGVVLSPKEDGKTFELSGLASICSEDGDYVMTYASTEVRKRSSGLKASACAPLTWNYKSPDREPPTIARVSFDGDTPGGAYSIGRMFEEIAVMFSEAVNFNDLQSSGLLGHAFSLHMLDVNGSVVSVLPSVDASYDDETFTVSWSVNPKSMRCGNARVVIDSSLVKDLCGNPLAATGDYGVISGFMSYEGATLTRSGSGSGLSAFAVAYACPTLYDWDGDGRLDLIVGEKYSDSVGKLRLYLNQGTVTDPLFGNWSYLSCGGEDIELAAAGCVGMQASFGNMPNASMILASSTGDIYAWQHISGSCMKLMFGHGLDWIDPRLRSIIRTQTFCCDIDGDGFDEVLVSGQNSPMFWMKCGEDGQHAVCSPVLDEFGNSLAFPAGQNHTSAVLADINGDSVKDLVTGDTVGNVWAYLGFSNTRFAKTPIKIFENKESGILRSRLAVGDLDGDGVEEILVGRSDGSILMLKGTPNNSPSVNFMVNPVVRFDLNGHGTRTGGGELSQTVEYGGAAVAPEVAPGYGWNFTGWDKDFGNVTESMVVTAGWSRVKWPVVVNNPDGTAATNLVEHESKIVVTAPEPTVDALCKTQTVYLGSSLTAPEVKSEFEITATAAVTVDWDVLATNYWFAASETVNGEIGAEAEGWKSYGAEFTLTATPAEHYHLANWTGDVGGCAEDDNTILVTMDQAREIGAEFAIDTFEVTFDLNGHGTRTGGGELSQTVEYGGAAVAPEVAPGYGWNFTGWDKDFGNVTESMVVTAGWSRVKWPVVVNNPDGTATTNLVEHESKIVVAAPEPTVDALCKTQIVYLGSSLTAPEVKSEFEITATAAVTVDWDVLATNYWFAASETVNGEIGAEAEGWKSYGAEFTLTATPAEHYHLANWTGDVGGCAEDDNTILVTMDQAREIGAEFAIDEHKVVIGGGLEMTIPSAGAYDYAYGSMVTVTVVNAIFYSGATQFVCQGWSAVNTEPEGGDGTQTVFKVVGDTEIKWMWQTNVLTLAEAVNAPDMAFELDGLAGWMPEWSSDSPDGLHRASICGVPNNSSAYVVTKVDGAGTLHFSWCSRLASRNTKLQFMLDDSAVRMLTGTNGWDSTSVTILDDGEHTLKWRLFTGRTGASVDDFAAFDNVVWEPRLPPSLAEALNTNLVWRTGGDVEWSGAERASLIEEGEAWAQVVGLGDNGTSWISTRVYGTGILSFDWAVSCEEEYDWIEFSVDGEVLGYLDGQTDWVSDAVKILGEGWHEVRWEYVKDIMDDPDLAGANLAMLDNVEWISKDIPATDTPVPVPYPEIERNFKTYLDAANGDYEAAALAVGKNGYAIWECYVAGLDPDNPESKFRITDIKFEDGELKITWSPDLKDARKYTEYGRKELGGSERWTNMKEVDSAEKNDYKFRKVTVDMP